MSGTKTSERRQTLLHEKKPRVVYHCSQCGREKVIREWIYPETMCCACLTGGWPVRARATVPQDGGYSE